MYVDSFIDSKTKEERYFIVIINGKEVIYKKIPMDLYNFMVKLGYQKLQK